MVSIIVFDTVTNKPVAIFDKVQASTIADGHSRMADYMGLRPIGYVDGGYFAYDPRVMKIKADGEQALRDAGIRSAKGLYLFEGTEIIEMGNRDREYKPALPYRNRY